MRVDAPEDEQRRLDELGDAARATPRSCGCSRRSVRRSSTCAAPTPPTRASCWRSPSCGWHAPRGRAAAPDRDRAHREARADGWPGGAASARRDRGRRTAGGASRPDRPAKRVGALRKRRPAESAPPADAEPRGVAAWRRPAPAEPKEPTEPKPGGGGGGGSRAADGRRRRRHPGVGEVLPELPVAHARRCRRRSRSRSTATSSRSACAAAASKAAGAIPAARPTTIRDALSRHARGAACGSSSVRTTVRRRAGRSPRRPRAARRASPSRRATTIIDRAGDEGSDARPARESAVPRSISSTESRPPPSSRTSTHESTTSMRRAPGSRQPWRTRSSSTR